MQVLVPIIPKVMVEHYVHCSVDVNIGMVCNRRHKPLCAIVVQCCQLIIWRWNKLCWVLNSDLITQQANSNMSNLNLTLLGSCRLLSSRCHVKKGMSNRLPLWATITPMGLVETESSSLSSRNFTKEAPISSNSRQFCTSWLFIPVNCVMNWGMGHGGFTSSWNWSSKVSPS